MTLIIVTICGCVSTARRAPYPGIPPASMWLASVTSLLHTSYCHFLRPSTPHSTPPVCRPTRMFSCTSVCSHTHLQPHDTRHVTLPWGSVAVGHASRFPGGHWLWDTHHASLGVSGCGTRITLPWGSVAVGHASRHASLGVSGCEIHTTLPWRSLAVRHASRFPAGHWLWDTRHASLQVSGCGIHTTLPCRSVAVGFT